MWYIDLEQKYYIAIKADEEVTFKYNKVKDWMVKLSQPQDQILKMLNPTSDSDFYNQNKDKIIALQQSHEQLNKLIDIETKREEIKNIVENFKKKNFVPELQQIVVMTPQDRQAAIQKLTAPIDAEFAKINQGVINKLMNHSNLNSFFFWLDSRFLPNPRPNGQKR